MWVVDFQAEMRLHKLAPGIVGAIDVRFGRARVAALQLHEAPDPRVLRGHEPDMEASRQRLCQQVGGAAGEDEAAHVGELDYRLRDALLEFPDRRMQPDDLADCGVDFGDLVLGKKPGQPLGQIVARKGKAQEVLVQEDPILAVFAEFRIQSGQERTAEAGCARADLARKRDERADRMGGRGGCARRGALQPGFQDGQSVFEVGMGSHWCIWGYRGLMGAAIPGLFPFQAFRPSSPEAA